MAGTFTPLTHHVIRTITRTGPSFSGRVSTKSNGVFATCGERELAPPEGPSCIFVGPVETASKETLEALYRQARDAYYSGKPLIVDEMFDRVELKLRCYGSKFVVKYPRCSIRRQSTYSDAEGRKIYHSSGIAHGNQTALAQFLVTVNAILFMAVGSLIGYPIASSSVKVLQGLWRNDLVALKGACPNCGEEVFAFVSPDQSNNSPHRADCHVCESLLEFQAKAEQTVSSLGRRWVHGRIYLVSRRRQRWK